MPDTKLLPLQSSVAWAPRDAIAPTVARDEDGFVVRSNGSAGCYGGWDLIYPLPAAPWVHVRVTASIRDVPRCLDSLHAALVWEGKHPAPAFWEPLLPVGTEGDAVVYEARCLKPPAATGVRLRLLMAWSPSGEIRWSVPMVTEAEPPAPRRWRLGAAGGSPTLAEYSVASNTEFYLGLPAGRRGERGPRLPAGGDAHHRPAQPRDDPAGSGNRHPRP